MCKKFILSVLCALVFTLISGCSLSYTSDDIENQPLSTIKNETINEHVSSIHFNWLAGDIIFYESEDDSILLIEKATDTFALENKFTTSFSNETLYIEDYDKKPLQLSINVNYVLEVYLPQKEFEEINIQVESGNITTNNIVSAKNLIIEANSANCDINGSFSDILANSVSGNIELTFQNMPEKMSIDGTSSDVSLTFPPNSGFVLHLDLISGDFDNVFQTTSKDSNTMIYGNGANDIYVSLVSGDLNIMQSK